MPLTTETPAAPLEFTARAREPGAAARVLRPLGSIAGPIIGLALVLGIFGTWRPDTFLSPQAFRNVFDNNYHYAVAAVGATFVIITAGIDLSVGSTMLLANVLCAMAIRGFSFPPFDAAQDAVIGGGAGVFAGMCAAAQGLQRGKDRWHAGRDAILASVIGAAVGAGGWALAAGHVVHPQPLWAAFVVAIVAGVLVGMLNGSLITMLSLPPFIVTLATMGAIRGLAQYLTNGLSVGVPPAIASGLHYGFDLNAPPVVAPNVWIALAVVGLSIPLLHFSVLGRYAYAIGSNERTARLCGVKVERWKTICYVIAGLTAGLAGAMMTCKFNGSRPTNFLGLELTVIAAVVIGGTSLFGGEGTLIGSVLGVLMLGFLATGCTIAGISDYVQPIFVGAIIVLAAAVDRFRHLWR